ncbi:hypothetical protein CAPTEDRAFT_205087 [Capitella teleta]|uniref:Uncharacterized protein n=1 Tax=Capitella teleta TaxID=283909 RepID=R7TGU5_CAPTE|nr:hypothetical protein CAPTEDRAFT_205087 [Capitella teleta]|eukprot:ELT90305.1 hypothetical protein CAPTEDRAFT_205087 [Capitella teleta]
MAEGLAKARAGARRWASRTSNRLTEVLSAPESGVDDGARLKNKEIAVRDAIQELEKRITALDAAQEKYELELPEEQLDADIEGSSVLRETLREPLVSATAWLSSQQEEPRGVPGPTPSVASSSMFIAPQRCLAVGRFAMTITLEADAQLNLSFVAVRGRCRRVITQNHRVSNLSESSRIFDGGDAAMVETG